MPDTVSTNNDYDDDGSLFGSPPPSPSRGRSPSPLAFPSGTAQNVGTLALPGSHFVAEMPVTPPALSSLSASATAPSAKPVCRPPSRPRPPLQSPRRHSAEFIRAPHTENAVKKTNKRKGRTTSATPRPTPPPITLPSPDEIPPPNFLRNQQALLGVAGMVGGVNPANLPKMRHVRGTTAENPIVIEDDSAAAQQPSIGKRPVRMCPSDSSQLPRPTSEQILGTLLQQKNILPVVVSLLRLLVPEAHSLGSVPPNSSSFHSFQPPQIGFASSTSTRSQSPEQASSNRHTPGLFAPPLKRRKLNSVPAGAGDWDVPYPFQEGQGPQNYRDTWEQERGKQLLTDLVQLIRGAAQKAATKAWYQQQRVAQPGSTKYYRPATFYYGLERPNARYHAQSHSSDTQTPTLEASTVVNGTVPARTNTLTPMPVQHVEPTTSTQSATATPLDISNVAFDHLVESLFAAQQQQEPVHSTSDATVNVESLQEGTQALFDNWLEMLTAFPPGDPNDPSGSLMHATSSLTDSGISSKSPSSMDPCPISQTTDAMIDPILLNLATDAVSGLPSQPAAPASADTPTYSTFGADIRGVTSACTAAAQPLARTPSLVASPSVTATSLAESGDAGPATPSWDWTFPDLRNVDGTKILDQLAGMDFVDMPMPDWPDGTTSDMPAPGTLLPESASSLGPPEPCSQPQAATQLDSTFTDPAFTNVSTETSTTDPAVAPQPPDDAATFNAFLALSSSSSSTAQASSRLGPPCASVDMPPPPQPAPLAQLVPATGLSALLPDQSTRAKGKTKAVSGTSYSVGVAAGSAPWTKHDRGAVVERARAMRAALMKEVERAKVALWETTLEQGVLVGLGKEFEQVGGGS